MRQGRVFRRCTATGCGRRVEAKRCGRCVGDRFTWTYVVDVAPREAPRDQRTKGGFGTKAAALEAMNTLQSDISGGTFVEPSRQTVAAYLGEWIKAVRPPAIRGGTWRGYRDNVDRLIVPRIGDVPLQHLTRAKVKALYAELATSGGRGGRPLAVKTVHNVHLTLRRALGDAVDDRILTSNPADGAHRLPRDRGLEMKTWTGAELGRFLAGVADDALFGLWRLASQTGMRRGELLGLRWRDVDLEAGRVQVVQQRVRGEEGVVYGPPKTTAGRRRIDLDAVTMVALREHRRRQVADRLAFGPGYADADLVFAHADGSPLDPDSVSGSFERAVRRLSLPAIRLHDLRHTHATLALSAGIHPKVVQERLGHSSITVTMDVYSHAIPAMQADAATRIAAIVDEAVAR